MQQEQLYYTPELSELFVGYRHERRVYEKGSYQRLENSNKTQYVAPAPYWVADEMDEGDFADVSEMIGREDIRTRYLSREDIEGEGWKFVHDNGFLNFKWGPHSLIFNEEYGRLLVTIQHPHPSEPNHWGFVGWCKSINEFRKIIKLMGITKDNRTAPNDGLGIKKEHS